MNELDVVVLKRDLPDEGLARGDVGTVVMVHEKGAAVEVEFASLSGTTLAVVTLDVGDVRPVTSRDVAHAREVA
jgi:hypothetical protein